MDKQHDAMCKIILENTTDQSILLSCGKDVFWCVTAGMAMAEIRDILVLLGVRDELRRQTAGRNL
ncbi:MAG TPA: hypothetical protein DEA71_15245 [Nitrospira sp.]|nr:hypothetical protein [Nitrospira sp.]